MSRKDRHFQGTTHEIRNFPKITISESFVVSGNFVSEGNPHMEIYRQISLWLLVLLFPSFQMVVRVQWHLPAVSGRQKLIFVFFVLSLQWPTSSSSATLNFRNSATSSCFQQMTLLLSRQHPSPKLVTK